MMPIYAILAWLPARLTGNKLALWYTHKSVDLKLRVATSLVNIIFTASSKSFRLSSPKVRVVGHGIDVDKFQHINMKPKSNAKFQIASVGRISRVKDYETLIKATEILVNEVNEKDITVEIFGDPAVEEDFAYLQSLEQFVKSAGLEENVFFRGGVSYDKVPSIYKLADLVVNMSQTGSLDKGVLEAAASGVLVVSSNVAFTESLRKISESLVFERDNPKLLAERILELKEMSADDRGIISGKLQDWIASEHNLGNLVDRILQELV